MATAKKPTRSPSAKGNPTPRQTSSREDLAAQRREQLLDAALELFCAHGYAGTSTKKIAARAGVVEGLVFHYFPSKEHVLLAVAARSTTFAGRARDVLTTAADRSAKELFDAIASSFGEVSGQERMFVGFMLAEAQVNPSLGEHVRLAHTVAIDTFSKLLRARVEAGELRPDVTLEFAIQGFLGGFVFFLGQNRHLADVPFRKKATRFAKEWANLCWSGLATR